MTRTRLSGWGRTAPTWATVDQPTDLEALRAAIRSAGERGVVSRGLGRSYGDPAQNSGGTVLDLTAMNRISELDLDGPSVRVQAGVSLDTLLRHVLPHGLWIPVLPGTRQVTVGGAIAADVHGKNHHIDGSFGQHIVSMDVLLANGDVVTLTPDGADAELFWAVVGGMGLLGVVVEATLALHQVETSYFVVDTDRTPDLPSMMQVLAAGEDLHRYSVAWFDTATTGRSTARGVVTQGGAARLDDLPADLRPHALEMAAPRLGRVPATPPFGFVNGLSARAFNALWYTKAPQMRRGEVQNLTQFFHPLDVIDDWNRVYGPKGFCQYQCVIPFGAEETLTHVIDTIAASSHVSSLNVLKRFGPANRSPMSFPMPGWTLAIDLPTRRGLDALLDHLDAVVVGAGGRIYLAKDSRASATTIHRMYPRLEEFSNVRSRVDPTHIFQSDLSRRLDL